MIGLQNIGNALLLASLLALSACTSEAIGETPKASAADTKIEIAAEQGVISHLSGAAYMTSDIDASVDFYTHYLGFVLRKRSVLDNDGTRAVFGLAEGVTVDYAALLPVNFSKERSDFTALNFAQINQDAPVPFAADANRAPMSGEPVMAFNVTQLADIAEKMEAAGVAIIDPLKTSSTGKSMTLTVLDPNGVRVQMYEIFKTPKVKAETE